jgi:Xylose isomerase-like TIM barrel
MKLACSSASFDALIAAGQSTQLEWLDRCATEFDVDGVVLEARHLPRIDPDYVAQIKKMATDLGLTIAALACDEVLANPDAADEARRSWFEIALGLGAPLVVARAPAAGDSAGAWGDLVSATKAASGEAKRRNVTLAVRNAAGSLCSAPADLTQLVKEVDSSWLRFAPELRAFDPAGDLGRVLPKTVIAEHRLDGGADDGLVRTLEELGSFIGFLMIEVSGQDDDGRRLRDALDRARATLARRTLAEHPSRREP